MAFANIKWGIEKVRYDLNELLSSDNFLLEFKESKIWTKLELKLDPHNEKILKSLKQKYINNLIKNIDARFKKCKEVFNAFRIFDPKLLPSGDSTDFKCYGMDEVKIIGHHFFWEGHW